MEPNANCSGMNEEEGILVTLYIRMSSGINSAPPQLLPPPMSPGLSLLQPNHEAVPESTGDHFKEFLHPTSCQ